MKIVDKENYSILEDDKNNVTGFSNYLENHAYDQIKDKNVVIDLLKYDNLSLEELLTFLNLSNNHRKQNKSFILVNNALDIDEIPDELAVVPTLHEAEDYIQMDELQREFGLE